MTVQSSRLLGIIPALLVVNHLSSHRNTIIAFSPTTRHASLRCHPRFRCHRRNNNNISPRLLPSSSRLRNVPLEDVLELEYFELEAELDLAKPRDDASASAEEEEPKQIKAADAASIIAGTAIGGGFLALPSVTAPIGYAPAAVGLVAAWSFLLLSATAFIESAGLVAEIKGKETAAGEEDSNNNNSSAAASEDGAISVATVIRYAFGKKCALVGGALFVAQMLAVVTAQVVKGAEMFSDCVSFVPYTAGCLVPTTLAGLFAFGSRPEVVERANTALTATMVGGFVALIVGTVATGNAGGGAVSGATLFARADYSRLLPRGDAWALPVFVNMLCFGQAMPLVVERMVQGGCSRSSVSANNNNHHHRANGGVSSANGGHANGGIGKANGGAINGCHGGGGGAARASSLFRARSAAILGASVPIVLSLTWAAISTALVAPAATNPLRSLLSMGPAISVPVGLLAIGAIGTTLLGSFLAMGHFVADIVCMKLGYCSPSWMNACNAVAVAVPSVLACVGPSMYLPLLAFSGAYPTTILHGLSPALAALVLRRRAGRWAGDGGGGATTPRLVPGGNPTLIGLAATAVGLIGASTYLALRHFVGV